MSRLKTALLLFAGLVLVTGCQQTYWYRPATSPQQMRIDLAQSELDAQRSVRPYQGNTIIIASNSKQAVRDAAIIGALDAISVAIQESNMIDAEMRARGYVRLSVSPNPEPGEEVAVPVLSRAQPQIDYRTDESKSAFDIQVIREVEANQEGFTIEQRGQVVRISEDRWLRMGYFEQRNFTYHMSDYFYAKTRSRVVHVRNFISSKDLAWVGDDGLHLDLNGG